MWRKAKAFSAFLGNDKERETVEFLADIVYHLNDLNVKLRGENIAYYSWFDHYYLPFPEKV